MFVSKNNGASGSFKTSTKNNSINYSNLSGYSWITFEISEQNDDFSILL